MLEKNVAAMVREIRDSRDSDVISRNLAEIKEELNSNNPRIKTNAILKMGYMSMLGYDLSVAHLPIIEIMANPQFVLKRPAMFVASLAFANSDQDSLVLMTTNLFRKELVSGKYLEVGIALSCLSCVVTQDMADSLLSSVIAQVTASRPYVRKKVALTFFRLIEKSPQLFIPAFPKLKDLLMDEDQSVQSAAVSTFLEVAKRNPKLGIPLIPIFFHLFKETKNNWTLIKMIKLMELLCKVETRLFTKLVDTKTLLTLLESNKARSVEIEIIRLVARLVPLTNQSDAARELLGKSLDHLKQLIEGGDFNVKCLSINILVDLLQRGGKCDDVDFFFPVILASLGSTDSTVRQAAMKAMQFLVTSPSMCREVIQQLLTLFTQYEGKPHSQLDFVRGVLSVGCMSNFDLISDSEWYLRILVLLGGSEAVVHSPHVVVEIVRQYKQVALVKDAVASMKISVAALTNPKITLTPEIISACAWTVAEYSLTFWQEEHFTKENCEFLIGIFLDHSRRSCNSIETRITCLWSALRFAVTFGVHSGSTDLIQTVSDVLGDPKIFVHAPVSVANMIVVAKALVGEYLASDALVKDEIERTLFSRKSADNQPAPPKDIDRPMIELPANWKPSSTAAVSLATLTSLLGDDVYGQMDEDYKTRVFSLIATESVTPAVTEEPDPLEQLFTIRSVLASR